MSGKEVILIELGLSDRLNELSVDSFSVLVTSLCKLTVCPGVKGNEIDGWFDLKNNGREKGRIKMSLQFHSKHELEKIKQAKVINPINPIWGRLWNYVAW